MANSKTTKRALTVSVIALVLCFSMLLGTTYAWFTDSVSAAGNVIKSGTLNIDLLAKGGNIDTTALDAAGVVKDGDYYSFKSANELGASTTVFNYNLWEPGFVNAANVKVSTTGNLALKYTLNIVATGTVSALANVIDVYYAPSEQTIAARADVATALTRIGTLAEVLNGTVTIDDTLIPGTDTEDFATIALVMQESAGNEYQNLEIGSDFTIKVVAGQYTYETDTFDDQYDAAAPYGA